VTKRPEPALPTPGIGEAVETTVSALQALVRAVAGDLGAAGSGGEPWRLLSLAEAAERLGRSERWLRERVRRRELPVVRFDGKLAFQLDDLIAFAQAHRTAEEP
jgi:hypothetical protein